MAKKKPRKVRVITDKYFAELGRFVAAYAKLEYFIKALLLRHVGPDEAVGMALTGGMRLVDAMPAVRRLIIAKRYDQQYYNAVDAYFQSVNTLSKFRDKVVHRQINIRDDGAITFSNLTSAKSIDHIETEAIGINDLKFKTLEADHLMHQCMGLFIISQEDWDQLSPASRRGWPCPWIHKPVGPARENQQPRKAPQSQKRPPRASRP